MNRLRTQFVVLDVSELTIAVGERVALVGPNGAGEKVYATSALAGFVHPTGIR